MAVVITRTPWIDDDGTGTTGTVINQAVHTALYNEIDGALAKVAQLNGGNTFIGNQSIAGILSVTGFGSHLFSASGAGGNVVGVVNSAPASGNYAQIYVMNDASAVGFVRLLSSTTTTGGYSYGSGVVLGGTGSGGLSLAADQPSGAIRFYTGGATERMRIAPTGELQIATTANVGGGSGKIQIIADAAANNGICIQNINVSQNSMYYAIFYNSTSAIAGYIAQNGVNSVVFGTSSDARLKDDAGRATDLSALRDIVVHDFRWKADGIRDRGVFAQDAHALYPRAVCPGTDDLTDDGSLARPWMTDYSKFVPDLIVGWQHHDAAIAELRALLATLKGFPNA